MVCLLKEWAECQGWECKMSDGFYEVLEKYVGSDINLMKVLGVVLPQDDGEARETLQHGLEAYQEAIGEVLDYLREHPEVTRKELVDDVRRYDWEHTKLPI